MAMSSPPTTPMLSAEIWERILLGLSPKDFWTAMNTCPEWNQLMTPKKNAVLFPKILGMLKGYLPRETILTCRRLSKLVGHWTDELLSIDYGFEEMLTGGAKIAKFMSLMESRPFPERNPFIGRSVSTRNLQGVTEEQTNRRVEAVRQVLLRYGHHVRKFRFTERPLGFGLLESYVSLLRLLPNLKSITIYDSQLFCVYACDLKSLSLPKLEKLEELRLDDIEVFRYSCSYTVFCIRFLDEYGSQLTSLALDEQFLYDFKNYQRSLESLAPNIEEFEMYTSDVSVLKKLAATKWELEALDLSGAVGLESVPDLLAAVNNFASSLVTLELMWTPMEWRYFSDYRRYPRNFVVLPELRVLTLLYVALKVDWIWEFLNRSCKRLLVLYLEVEDESQIENAEETGLLEMHARRLFCVLPLLSKIVIDKKSTFQTERVIFRKP